MSAKEQIQRLIVEINAEHPDDAARLQAILDAPDGVTVAELIGAYYADPDRADRTPRGLLYFHLGTLGGIIERLLEVLQLPKQVH